MAITTSERNQWCLLDPNWRFFRDARVYDPARIEHNSDAVIARRVARAANKSRNA